MKYKCDVVRDLMPLCVDDSAAADSKKIVFEHLGECRDCEKYYDDILRDIHTDKEAVDTAAAEYTSIAGRYRKRNRRRRAAIFIIVCTVFLFLLNYALGYRFTALSAAEHSGRLNPTSEVIGTYDWNGIRFFFYQSDTNYDTIAAERHMNGWRCGNFYFVWPRYPADKGSLVTTSSIYYFKQDKGVLIFPVLCEDEDIKKIEITAFGEKKSESVQTGVLSVMAFENNDISIEDNAAGYAFDADGHIKYELQYDEAAGRWLWIVFSV